MMIISLLASLFSEVESGSSGLVHSIKSKERLPLATAEEEGGAPGSHNGEPCAFLGACVGLRVNL